MRTDSRRHAPLASFSAGRPAGAGRRATATVTCTDVTPLTVPRRRPALAACSHSMYMVSARRRLLRDNAAFEKRSWDSVAYSFFESGFFSVLPVLQAPRVYCLFALLP